MSKIKISEGLFLEKEELNRWQQFIFDQGFTKLLLHNTANYGIVRNKVLDPNFTWGLVQDGTNAETIKINFCEAIDKNGNIISQAFVDNVAVANDGNWYWVSIKHKASDEEEGLVSIDGNGNLTGVGTKFTEVLRGQPNFPSVISFTDALNNTLDYEVVEVLSDTNAILSGQFNAEANLKYRVVGTFTPGKVPETAEKGPFQYDSATLNLYAETTLNQVPSTILDGEEFTLARVKIQGGQVLIEDKRNELFLTQAQIESRTLDAVADNPLIGIESIKNTSSNGPRVENVAFIAWGMRSTNWSINANLNLLTIQSGNGGKYKSVADFTTGEFDGWRVYLSGTGALLKIISSVKSGSQINLTLETMDPELLSDNTQEIFIAPNTEEVQLKFTPNSGSDAGEKVVSIPTYLSVAKVPLEVYDNSSGYDILFRYKNNNRYTGWAPFPADPVGYYNENAFDNDGLLVDPTERTPTNGTVITVTQAADSYNDFKDRVDIGDKLGWEDISNLETTATSFAGRVIPIEVGVNKKRINILGSSALTADVYIDLDKSSAKGGNAFEFRLRDAIDDDIQYQLIFIQGGDQGAPLLTLNNELRAGNQIARFIFDEDEDSWNVIYENNAFRSYNHFTPGTGKIVSTSANTEVAADGQRVLVLEGNENVIKIDDDLGIGEIAYVKFRNQNPINELYLMKYGGSTDVTLIADGLEARNINDSIGDEALYAFNSAAQHSTDNAGGVFNVLNANEILHLVMNRSGNFGGSRQGYSLQCNSNDRQRLARALQPRSGRFGMVANSSGWGGSGTWYYGNQTWNPVSNNLPNDGQRYIMCLMSKVSVNNQGDGNNLKCESWLQYNGNDVDYAFGEFDTNKDELNFAETMSHVYTTTITASGQSLRLRVRANHGYRTYNAQIMYLLIPIEA